MLTASDSCLSYARRDAFWAWVTSNSVSFIFLNLHSCWKLYCFRNFKARYNWRQDTVIICLLKRKSLLCLVAQGSVYFCYDINISWTKITTGGAEYGAQNGLAPRSRYFLFTTKFYFLFFDRSKQKELQLGKAVPLSERITRLRLLSVGVWGTEKRQGHLGSHV